MAIAFSSLALDGPTVDWLVKEDSLVEWTGVVGLVVGCGVFVASFVRARRQRPAGMAPTGVWMLLVIAIALFILAGEEISWGQRLFGFDTPDAVDGVNGQHETTFHNINFLQGGTFDSDRLFRAGWMVFFVLLPAACWIWPGIRARLDPHLPLAPLWLAALFFASWVLALIALNVFDTSSYTARYPISHATSEIQESSVEVLLGIAGVLTLRRVVGISMAPTERDGP